MTEEEEKKENKVINTKNAGKIEIKNILTRHFFYKNQTKLCYNYIKLLITYISLFKNSNFLNMQKILKPITNKAWREQRTILTFGLVSYILFAIISAYIIAFSISVYAATDSTNIWNFNTSDNYIYSTSSIEITDGTVSLIQNNNELTNFGTGTHSNTQLNTNWIELDAAGVSSGAGNYTSDIIDIGGNTNFTSINWEPSQPTLKELPDNGQTEINYENGNADMSNNVLLMHMNEATGDIMDTSGNNNNGTNNGAAYGAESNLYSGLSFDGTDDYIEIADSSTLDFTNTFSFETWIKLNSNFNSSATSNLGIIDKDTYQIYFDQSDGTLKISLADSSQSSWSETFDGDQEGITALIEYDGKLYAGQTGGSNDGDIYVFDGNNWSLAYNSNAKTVSSFTVFNNKLYAGLIDNDIDDGDDDDDDYWSILVYDGNNWSTESDGYGKDILSLTTFNNKLYAGLGNMANEGDVLEFDGNTWTKTYNGSTKTVESLVVFNGKLYAGLGKDGGNGDVLEFDGDSWTTSYNGSSKTVEALAVHNNKLYAGLGKDGGNGDILEYNGSSWTTVYNGTTKTIESLVSFNGKLYAGRGKDGSEGDVLEYDGSSWTTTYDGSKKYIKSLAEYNGNLYAGQKDSNGNGNIYVLSSSDEIFTSIKTSWDTEWHHIGATYDGANIKLYVDGILDNSSSFSQNLLDSSSNLKIGVYDTDYFKGTLDELALYDRILGETEFLDHYKRFILGNKFQVRSCDDAICDSEIFTGPDGTADSYYSELTNFSSSTPVLALTNVDSNQYFQYKANLETSNAAYTPGYENFKINYSYYNFYNPTISNKYGISYTNLSSFSNIVGDDNEGSIKYQLSNNNTNWYYWNGTNWVEASAQDITQTNSATEINTNIAQFSSINKGDLHFKAFLISNGTQKVELSEVSINYNIEEEDIEGQISDVATSTTLTDESTLNLNEGNISSTTNGTIIIAGVEKSLDNFTSGDLQDVNLSTAQSIGGELIIVKKAVQIKTQSQEPLVITNASYSKADITILHETTVLAADTWDGEIHPPKQSVASGQAPTGFAIGDTVVEVGSPDEILLFDKAIKLTLEDVTGAVGYKSTGSTIWVKINTICNNADNPTNIGFPNECYIQSGADTIIWTYHFTEFGGLYEDGGDGGYDGGDGNDGDDGGGDGSQNSQQSQQTIPGPSIIYPEIPPSEVASINVPLIIEKSQEGSMTQTYLKNQDNIHVHIPIGAVSNTTTFNLLSGKLSNSYLPANNLIALVGDQIFQITAQDNMKNKVSQFNKKIKITFSVPELPSNTSTLGVYYFNENGKKWTLIPGANFDTFNKQVIFEIDHLTIFAVFQILDLPISVQIKGESLTKEYISIQEGDLIRAPDKKIYVIKNDLKHHISTLEELQQYSGKIIQDVTFQTATKYPEFKQAQEIKQEEAQISQQTQSEKLFPDNSLIRGSDKKIYVIKNSSKQHITSLGELQKHSGQEIIDVEDNILLKYATVPDISQITTLPVSESTVNELQSETTCSPIKKFKVFMQYELIAKEVRELQKVLKCLGYFPQYRDPSGYFGDITENAVRQFQKKHGIEAAGYVGPQTRGALNSYID